MRAPCAGTWVHFSVLKARRRKKDSCDDGVYQQGTGDPIYFGKTGSCLIL